MKAGNGLSPIIKEIMDISAYLWSKGWAEANGGNISVDVTDMFDGTSKMKFSPKASTAFKKGSYPSLKNRLFLISGSGCRFRDIAENPGNGICLIHLSDDGSMFNIIDSDESSSDIRPTSELPTHLLLHEYMRSTGMKERVVLHTHPTELTAISHIRRFWDENVFNRLLHGMLPEVRSSILKARDWSIISCPALRNWLNPHWQKSALGSGLSSGRNMAAWQYPTALQAHLT